MDVKHNHHFVPQGYLRGFTIGNQKSLLWEYDKHKGTISKCPKSVRSVCCIRAHNLIVAKGGTMNNNGVEDALDTHVESPALGIIRSLATHHDQERIHLTLENIKHLSMFIALLLTRGPSFRNGIEDMMQKCLNRLLEINVREMKEKGELSLADNFSVEVNHGASVDAMIGAADIGAQVLLDKKWMLLRPHSGITFVTSDCPAVMGYSGPVGAFIGPFHPLSEIIVPLRKDLALACEPERHDRCGMIDIFRLDKVDTERFNTRIAHAANRYVYASERSPDVLKLVQEAKGAGQRCETT